MIEKVTLGVAPVVRGQWRVDHLAEIEETAAAQPPDPVAAPVSEEPPSPDVASPV